MKAATYWTVNHAQEFQMALNQLQACLGNVTALSTSRSGALFPSMPVEVVEVQPLDAAQYPELDPTVARQLAEQCGNIPIALKVVASTVELQLTTAEVTLPYANMYCIYCIRYTY